MWGRLLGRGGDLSPLAAGSVPESLGHAHFMDGVTESLGESVVQGTSACCLAGRTGGWMGDARWGRGVTET